MTPVYNLTGITLQVEAIDASITEPGTMIVCFTSEISLPLKREASFQVLLSNLTTATPDSDFLPEYDSSLLTLPTNFSGAYEMCIDVIVFDDEEVESDEIIAYDVTPLSELDNIELKGDGSSLAFTVFDDDGKI